MKKIATMTGPLAALMLLAGCGGEGASENNQTVLMGNGSIPAEGNLAAEAGKAPAEPAAIAASPAPAPEPMVKTDNTAPASNNKAEAPRAAPKAEPKAALKAEPKAVSKAEPTAAPKAPATPACAPEHRALGHC